MQTGWVLDDGSCTLLAHSLDGTCSGDRRLIDSQPLAQIFEYVAPNSPSFRFLFDPAIEGS